MLIHRKISQKINKSLIFLAAFSLYSSILCADTNTDEDELFYDMTVEHNFRPFFKKLHRFPLTWNELKVKSSCYGGKDNLPKSYESLIWRPSMCEMSYKIVYSNRKSFKIAALKNGHIVSIFENYKATYFKTPYHSHEPAECPKDSIC
jgi:hypothetical protein